MPLLTSMRNLLILFALLAGCHIGRAQSRIQKPNAYPEHEQHIPLSMDIFNSGETIHFTIAADYQSSKTIPAYFQISVHGNQPWILTASTNTPLINAPGEPASGNVGIKLRNSYSGQPISLSGTPQVILRGENSFPENNFLLDLIIDPPFNSAQGNINGLINFELSAQ